jgi:ATPase subunit of ABC transporter with duplicated ATPase domains
MSRLRAESLGKSYRSRRVLKDLSLEVASGEVVGLLGPNGAGKTQLVQAVKRAFEHPGAIRVAPSARLGFSDQALSGVDLSETPFDAITSRFDLGDQAAAAMGALVPGVHRVQRRIGLMYGENRPFDALRQVGIGHHDGDLDDAVGIGVQPRHFKVDPDQILVAAGKGGV